VTDLAYLCHNCGSVHEVESIRENLIRDLRATASYELSGHLGMLDRHARFVRLRITRRLAKLPVVVFRDAGCGAAYLPVGRASSERVC
jgi:hypothetical protein